MGQEDQIPSPQARQPSSALAQGLLTDAEIRVVYRQEADVLEATKEALGLTNREIDEVSSLPKGMGLWKLGKRPFLVSNILTQQELEVFETSCRFDVDIPDEILVDRAPTAQAVVSQNQSVTTWTEWASAAGCDSATIHAATRPGKSCIRCGVQTPNVPHGGAAA